jgi:hypothetical protein
MWVANVNPCGNGFYCDSDNCGAGTCQPLPANDDQVAVPVCGCDGATYWNANTAAAHGTAVAQANMCSPGIACGGGCPQGLFCNDVVVGVGACGNAAGTCLGMPDQCSAGDPPNYVRCSAQTQDCVSLCEGVMLGEAIFQSGGC